MDEPAFCDRLEADPKGVCTLKIHFVIAGLLLFSPCADPLANVGRLGEVTLPDGATVASVVPGVADSADAPLVLDQLLTQDQPAPTSMATGPDAQQVAPGTLLPYGQIATVCGVSMGTLVTRIAAAAGYALYDSAPNQTALRVHYLSGFPDGCARIFSAALVLFGDVGTHEMVRYLPSNATMPYSRTDTAYEQAKAQFCGVPAGQPCGRKLDRLAAYSTFITIYETFGTNPEWGEIFLHQGQVMAIDVRRG